ncbi:MAG: DUF4199 domain-containing protein [Candidatus Amulumruptor caecigallinarius]|nr:DUF4199 domain-containing protein [Candidatus Amulumruptor caecigallinarius]MCM1396386.1 DUF4199 domain-containing protein [Candidatus Amulumruptor caecigallinarius]MCM1453557.1 DUF4199 domain-containing protein [bacterium]
MPDYSKLTNPYRQGADDGLWMGLYLSALFFASAFAVGRTLVGALATGMIIAVPIILFLLLRRTWRRDEGLSLFSGLWMQGIITFLCGGLISGVVAFAYLRWVNPGWLADQVRAMIALYSSIEGGAVIADTLSTMLDRHLLPSPIQMVIQMLWLEIFSGSILSLIVTALVRLSRPVNLRP